jgi:hypothetical protein
MHVTVSIAGALLSDKEKKTCNYGHLQVYTATSLGPGGPRPGLCESSHISAYSDSAMG